MAIVWQTSGHTTNLRGLFHLSLDVKIIVSVFLSIGVIYLTLTLHTFSRYSRIDDAWSEKLKQIIQTTKEKQYPGGAAHPPDREQGVGASAPSGEPPRPSPVAPVHQHQGIDGGGDNGSAQERQPRDEAVGSVTRTSGPGPLLYPGMQQPPPPPSFPPPSPYPEWSIHPPPDLSVRLGSTGTPLYQSQGSQYLSPIDLAYTGGGVPSPSMQPGYGTIQPNYGTMQPSYGIMQPPPFRSVPPGSIPLDFSDPRRPSVGTNISPYQTRGSQYFISPTTPINPSHAGGGSSSHSSVSWEFRVEPPVRFFFSSSLFLLS